MIPTEKGFIQVSGYSLENDFTTYEPVDGGINLSKVTVKALTGAIIGGAFKNNHPPGVIL